MVSSKTNIPATCFLLFVMVYPLLYVNHWLYAVIAIALTIMYVILLTISIVLSTSMHFASKVPIHRSTIAQRVVRRNPYTPQYIAYIVIYIIGGFLYIRNADSVGSDHELMKTIFIALGTMWWLHAASLSVMLRSARVILRKATSA